MTSTATFAPSHLTSNVRELVQQIVIRNSVKQFKNGRRSRYTFRRLGGPELARILETQASIRSLSDALRSELLRRGYECTVTVEPFGVRYRGDYIHRGIQVRVVRIKK